ncbi:uncharacterized protein GIQ15_00290 [Arthroderma uncinatum]|uniref:uncharacterized protein n=1 Tax=Arthroderma uncinatum TaxID=74035 RepID=UPI00144ADF83|nr:uncharacterized protein GIQ15_00290 [Arthroderma uncinatum]KAF3490773.1 hypothetical protein GIQ15_00290 [Arthroderma uncinatum]
MDAKGRVSKLSQNSGLPRKPITGEDARRLYDLVPLVPRPTARLIQSPKPIPEAIPQAIPQAIPAAAILDLVHAWGGPSRHT